MLEHVNPHSSRAGGAMVAHPSSIGKVLGSTPSQSILFLVSTHQGILSLLTTPTSMNYISSTLSNEDLSKAINDMVSINNIINGFSNHLHNITADDGHPPFQEASNATQLEDSDFSLKLPKIDPPKWIANGRGNGWTRGYGRSRGCVNGRSNIQLKIPSDGTRVNHVNTLDTPETSLETSGTAVETSGTPLETSGTVENSGTPVETSGTVENSGTPVETTGTPVEISGTPVRTFRTAVETS
ncbi:hypothetical protein BDD12DRAFT_889330 [Trichophaea hybrida]|nr:hypothetical protein BDD12DRAFT_889330 [Trichophaea hybrida]